MKKLIVFVLIVVAGYFAYQYFSGGNLSDEQKQVQALADEFLTARQHLTQAERSAAVGGLDTTSDADDAMHAVGLLQEKLQALKEKLSDEKAIAMAEKLAQELQSFLENKGK
jgi:predicted negative regulator of RcsB-dependent stress response